jgi:nucleotide-binding universal stress UspA family protein
MSTIVVAMDGSSASQRALDRAVDYAHSRSAEIILAHARTHAIEPDMDETLADLAAKLRDQGLRVSTVVKVSLVGEEAEMIAEAAREAGAELIVIGSRGRTAFVGAVLGSVSQRILHEAPCPVLIVPEHEASSARPQVVGSEAREA